MLMFCCIHIVLSIELDGHVCSQFHPLPLLP
jgi:hypothetical protein